HGLGFSAQVCKSWEAAFRKIELPRTRKVLLRIGGVFGRGGVALRKLELLTKLFLVGSAGDGSQLISWIHQEDMNRIFQLAIEDETVPGVYNATGPSPVSNTDLMRALRRDLKRPWSPPSPKLLVHHGALLFRTEAELALTSRGCVPHKLQQAG